MKCVQSAGIAAGWRAALMEFIKLTWRHNERIPTSFPCSVEECSLPVGKVVGYSIIKSAVRMISAVVIFFFVMILLK